VEEERGRHGGIVEEKRVVMYRSLVGRGIIFMNTI